MQTSAEAMAVDRASVWLLIAPGGIGVRILSTKRGAALGGARLDVAQYPRYFAELLEEQVVDAHDVASDPRTAELLQIYLQTMGIASLLDVPIFFCGRLAGLCAMNVSARRDRGAMKMRSLPRPSGIWSRWPTSRSNGVRQRAPRYCEGGGRICQSGEERLSATMSHEIRTPMNAIIMADLLSETLSAKTNGSTSRFSGRGETC